MPFHCPISDARPLGWRTQPRIKSVRYSIDHFQCSLERIPRFVNTEPYACDCDTSTGLLVCDLFDFLCFQNAFVSGCP